MLLSMPLMNLMMSDDMTEGPEKSTIEKVYVYNMTMYRPLDVKSELTPAYQHIVLEDAKESYEVVEARLAEEEKMVFVSDLAESSVNMGVRLWVKSEDYWQTRWRMMENIKYALDENGIEIPFPQRDLHIISQ